MMVGLVIVAIMLVAAIVLLVVGLVFSFVVAPLRTVAMILQKIAGVAGVLLTIAALAIVFVDKKPLPWDLGLIIVGCIVVGVLTQWFIERPTRAERRAAQRRQEELDFQQRQYENSIRQQTLYDLRARRTDIPGVYSIPISPQVAQVMSQPEPPVKPKDPMELPADVAFEPDKW